MLAYICSNSEKAVGKLDLLLKNNRMRNIKSVTDLSPLKAIVVIGGDGAMLHSLREYMYFNIPFYGINAGNIGFLTNDFDCENGCVLTAVSKSIKEILRPLEVNIYQINGQIHSLIAINDASVYRATNQCAKFKIIVNSTEYISEMVGDGALVATPAGSSAYNFSAGGSILPISSRGLSLTAICPFRPRRWKGAILPSNSIIEFCLIDCNKRPVNATVDFIQIKDASRVVIKESSTSFIELLFDDGFESRVIKEQFCI